MRAKKPLPKIAPCLAPGCKDNCPPGILKNPLFASWHVVCGCGWMGPTRRTERGAINAWGRRAKDELDAVKGVAIHGLKTGHHAWALSRIVEIVEYAKASKDGKDGTP
jgi:hypothetical protein